MLVIIAAALLVVVALTLLVIVVVGLSGRLVTLRRQLRTAQQRLDDLDRALARPGEAHRGVRDPSAAAGTDVR